MHKLIQNFVIVKRKLSSLYFRFHKIVIIVVVARNRQHHTFGSQANLYDGQLFVQSHVFITKQASVDDFIRL